MSPWRTGVSVAALSLCLVGLTACGQSDPSPVVARVAGAPIREATVAAWARAIESGSAGAPIHAPAHASARERALDFLISAHWLIDEAAERGSEISPLAVQQGLSDRIEAAPNGREEFQDGSAKQTISGLKLEVKAELAVARLRAMVSRNVARVTHNEIAAYYKRHLASFRIRERRQVDLVEKIPSRAIAIALGKRLGTGARFASRAEHELVPTPAPYEADTPKFNTGLVQTIFAARPGKLTGPVPFSNAWTLLVVRQVEPGGYVALTNLEPLIVKRLREQHRRAAFARFARAYRARWTARTSCRPGFVVSKCSQYDGPAQAEGDPLAYFS